MDAGLRWTAGSMSVVGRGRRNPLGRSHPETTCRSTVDSALGTAEAFERSVLLAPCVDLFALGTGHSVEADRTSVPACWVGREPSRNSATRHWALDHNTSLVWVFAHHYLPSVGSLATCAGSGCGQSGLLRESVFCCVKSETQTSCACCRPSLPVNTASTTHSIPNAPKRPG